MHDDLDWKLLDEYLTGTASAEQRAAVERWLSEAPNRQATLEALRKEIAPDSAAWNVDAAWSRVSANIARQSPPTPALYLSSRAPRPHLAWRIAAMLLVVAGVGLIGKRALQSPPTAASTRIPQVVVTTNPGQRLLVTLPDGSTITLNAGSRVAYDTATNGNRDVTLDGEAYFDVRHDPSRPFRVHAHGGVAEDVGTRFVVRAYSSESGVDVAVAEGAVRVQHESDSSGAKLVGAGMLGSIPLRGAPVVSTLENADRFFAWTHGVLSLDGQTLREAIPALEHWYGVTIVVDDATLGAKRVYGTFKNETLQQALAAISLALDADYREAGRTITITPRGK